MELSITQEDLDKARQEYKWGKPFGSNVCEICPIAQALMRMGYTEVRVGTITVRGKRVTGASSKEQTWFAPDETEEWMVSWGPRHEYEPTTLILEE